MKRVANSAARELVQRRQVFKGSNTFAEERSPETYVVYSYGKHWPMFLYDAAGDQWFENMDRYSMSTSRQHSQLHPLVRTTRVCTSKMIELAEKGADRYCLDTLKGARAYA